MLFSADSRRVVRHYSPVAVPIIHSYLGTHALPVRVRGEPSRAPAGSAPCSPMRAWRLNDRAQQVERSGDPCLPKSAVPLNRPTTTTRNYSEQDRSNPSSPDEHGTGEETRQLPFVPAGFAVAISGIDSGWRVVNKTARCCLSSLLGCLTFVYGRSLTHLTPTHSAYLQLEDSWHPVDYQYRSGTVYHHRTYTLFISP